MFVCNSNKMTTKEIYLKSLAQTAERPPAACLQARQGLAEVAPGQAKIPNPIRKHGQTKFVHASQSQIVNRKSEIVNPTLSLCMIVKNEEKFLPGCLESVKGFVDEIIIVDTGSTDNTIEIAKRFGAKVYHHAWENSFCKARNYSLKYATCDWILILDADEEIDKKDVHKLKEVIKDPVGKDHAGCEATHRVNVIYLPVFSKHKGENGLSAAASARIFRNHLGFHYEGIVHNALIFSGPVKKVNIKAYHHGYNQDEEQMERKFLRTSTLLKEQIKTNPEDPNPYQYLATAYLERKKYDECIQAALKAIELYERHDKSSRLLLLTYYTISVAYRNKNELENAKKCSLRAIELYPHYIDHYDILSIIYFLQKDYKKFFNFTKKFLELLKEINENPSTVLEVPYNTLKNAWLSYSRMSIVFFKLGKEHKGVNALKSAVKCANNVWEPYFVIAKHFFGENDFDKAERFFNEGLELDPGNKSILYYMAEMYEKSGFPDKALVQFRKITEYYPDDIPAQYRLGLLFINAEKYDEAIDSFKKVINKDTEHTGALFNMAVACESVGDNIQAKDIYSNILTRKPDNAEALVRSGSLYLNESNFTKAKECFLNTIKLDKYLIEAYLALSKIYICLNDLEGCVNSCDELMKNLSLPRNVTINSVYDLSKLYVNIGKILMEQKSETLAEFSFDIAAILAPGTFEKNGLLQEEVKCQQRK